MAAEIRNEAVGLKAGTLAVLTAVLWGGNPVAIKVGLDGVPPAAMAGLRFALGALTVWVGALFAGIQLRIPSSEWKGLGGLALLFALQIWLLNAGTQYTTASRSGVVVNIYPFFTAFFAHLLVGDRLGLGQWFGLLISFAGVVLLFWESLALAETQYLLGDAMVAASGLLLGLRQVVIKRLVQGLNPYQVLFWQAVLSLPLFAAWSAFLESEAEYVLTGPVVARRTLPRHCRRRAVFYHPSLSAPTPLAGAIGGVRLCHAGGGGAVERRALGRGHIALSAGQHGVGGCGHCGC